MKKIFIILLLIFSLTLSACTTIISRSEQTQPPEEHIPSQIPPEEQPSTSGQIIQQEQIPVEEQPPVAEEVTQQSSLREFTVYGFKYGFTPSEIRVKKGDRVKINFISEDSDHDLVITGISVRTKVIDEGETDSIEFTADKTGTFEIFCSVGDHREEGMIGKFIVEP